MVWNIISYTSFVSICYYWFTCKLVSNNNDLEIYCWMPLISQSSPDSKNYPRTHPYRSFCIFRKDIKSYLTIMVKIQRKTNVSHVMALVCLQLQLCSFLSFQNAQCLPPPHWLRSPLLVWNWTSSASSLLADCASLSVPPHRISVWFPKTKALFNSAGFFFLYIVSCQLIGTKLAMDTCLNMVTCCVSLIMGEGEVIQLLCF